MNYLTNYYKNLCEQLQNKINFLEKSLNENLNVELNKLEYPQELENSGAISSEFPTETETTKSPKINAPVKPIKGKYPYQNESDSDYARRMEEYLKELKAYERYKKECASGGCTNVWVYPNPPHPLDPNSPKWKEGDVYINDRGIMFRRESGKWVKV